jgi:DNA-binding response OmpR family regulator
MIEKGKILIVDDNINNQEICKICLESENYAIYLAENGEQGLALTRQIKPDLILLDIMMPIMDGYQMLERLKAAPDIKHIPVLVLMAVTEPLDVVKAFRLGANDLLKKPFHVDEFVVRVNALVKQKKSLDDARSIHEKLRHQQKIMEFQLVRWTREAEAFQRQLDVAFAQNANDAYAGGIMDQVLSATQQAKKLISQMISFGMQKNEDHIWANKSISNAGNI